MKRTIQNYYLSKSRRIIKNFFKRVFEINNNSTRKVKTTSFIFDFERYALMRKAKHEQLTGMKDSDYGAVKIDWDLLGQIKLRKQSDAEYKKDGEYKLKHHSVQTTYFPNRKSRMTWD